MKYTAVARLSERFASHRALVRAATMFVRGAMTRPFFGASRGPLFRGKNVTVLNASYITHAGRLVLEEFVELQGVSQRGISLGADVSIGRNISIRPSSYYWGEAGQGLKVGDRSSIASGGFIGCSGWIEIGNDVLIGPGVRLFSENHSFDRLDVTIKEQGVVRGELIIEDDSWIGSGVTVMSGVRVRRGTVIAGGSVVTKDTPENSVVGGIPARVIRLRGAGE